MPIIQLQNVSYTYNAGSRDKVEAVKDVTLQIEEGSFVALVGHNGSGKSTLAKLLNGLLLPTSGSVSVYGIDTKQGDSIYEIRKNVGMVFQNPDNQMIASIVEDDIAFGPENLGVEREEIIRRVDWALEKVGMLEHKKGTPFKMSGGQKQRLAIAGVLAIKPRVLVLDESTAMLDPRGRREVMQVAKELNKQEGITVINITHYMDEALGADRLIVMNEGKIVLDDTPSKVFAEHEYLRSIKLSVPPVTALAVRLANQGVPISTAVTTKEELVEELCRLL